MPRKVFISFLGAIPYHETRYFFKADRSDLGPPMYYVQEAILRLHPVDEVLIFTTEKALTDNYFNRLVSWGNKAKDEGLERILEGLKAEQIIGNFTPVEIPNGYSESEIWVVFQKVFKELQEDDEVIFDVTFGFRSLPMLVIVLLNYAQTLLDVTVKKIYYGIYEAGRAEKEEKITNTQNEDIRASLQATPPESPVLDLLPFAALQEWTYAAQSFLWAGNSQRLADLTANTQPEFSEEILNFTQAILTCRGFELSMIQDIDFLKMQIQRLNDNPDLEVQLQPLLKKVKNKISPFRSNTLTNGLSAVNWCIDHGLVQQGITFLQETLISLVIENTIGVKNVNNQFWRFTAGTALNGYRVFKGRIREKEQEKTNFDNTLVDQEFSKMRNWVDEFPGLSDSFKKLTGSDGFRNDINHCGFKDSFLSAKELQQELIDLNDAIKKILK